MLNILRHKPVQRGLFIALCVLIIPGFVFMSVTDHSSGLNETAGTIGGHKIKVQEFVRNFEAMRRELEVFGGADLSRLGASVDFEALAWQRILLVRAAKAAGVRVSDKDVVEWIQKQPPFQDSGSFSEERYNLIVDRYLKMDVKAFEEETREYLALQRYRDQVRGTYEPTDAELRERYDLLDGPRRLEYVIFAKDSVPAPSAATEDELRAMFNRLSGRLLSQEAVQVRYISVDAKAAAPSESAETALWDGRSVRTPYIAKDEPITGIGSAPALSAAIFALKGAGDRTGWLEHNGQKHRFELIEHKPQAPMAYDDAQKVLADLVSQEKVFRAVIEKASAFHEKAAKEDWSSLTAAEKLTVLKADAYTPGGYLEKIGKVKSVAEALSELKTGEVSGPVPTSNGLAVFKVISQSPADPAGFDAKKKELERDLRLKREMAVFGKVLQALQSDLKPNPKALAKLFPSKYSDSPASK